MATVIQQLKGTAAEIAAKTYGVGVLVWNETTKRFHGHDGATAGGIAMAREDQKNDGSFAYLEAVKTDDYAIGPDDKGICLIANKATAITFTLGPAAMMGANFNCAIKNVGAGTLTIVASGAETIDGAASLVLASGGAIMLRGNGTLFRSFFTSGLNRTGDSMTGPLDMLGNPIRKVGSINGGILAGLRNRLINGAGTILNRGGQTVSAGASAYVFDRWLVTNNTNQPVIVSQFQLALGAAFGGAKYAMRYNFASAPTSGTLRIAQRIEDVTSVKGDHTLTSYMTGPAGNETLAAELVQNFGTSGSSSVTMPMTFAAGTPTTIYSAATNRRCWGVSVPPISGKVLGTANDYVEVATVLTPRQAGNYDITWCSFVQGDATLETDPFSPRDPVHEDRLCRRYLPGFLTKGAGAVPSFGTATSSSQATFVVNYGVVARAAPTGAVVQGAGIFTTWGAAQSVTGWNFSGGSSEYAGEIQISTSGTGFVAGDAGWLRASAGPLNLYFTGCEL